MENPFTNKNRHIIDDYFVTLNDWNLLKRIENREIETKSLYVDGRSISDKSLPMKEYDDYLSSLYPKIGEIDHKVYHFLQKNCKESDRTKLGNAYSLLFYAETALSTSLTNLINGGAQARANLNAMMESYQGFNVNAAMQIVQQYVAYFRQCLKEMNPEAIELAAGKDYFGKVEEFLAMSEDEKNVSELNYLNKITGDLPNDLYGIHQSLIGLARKTLCEISEPFNLKDEQKDILSGEQKENKRIDPITIDYTAGGASIFNIMSVFAVLFAIIALLCYLLYPKQDDSESVTESENTEILRTPYENEGYTNPNSKNDIMSVMSRGNGEPLTPKDNEITDGRVAFALPNSVHSEKVYPVEGDTEYYGYDILDNEQHPSYSIRVLSKYMNGAFGYNEFEELLKKYDKERSLEKIVRTRADNSRYLDNNTFCYEANRIYETDPKMATDIAVIRSYSRHVLCYIICERTEEAESPFDDIVKSLRFE